MSRKGSQAKALKKRLTSLDAEIARCEDPAEREELQTTSKRLRTDLEQAGYLAPSLKQAKRPKNKQRAVKKKPPRVDSLVRAQTRPGFVGVSVRFVQGGTMSRK